MSKNNQSEKEEIVHSEIKQISSIADPQVKPEKKYAPRRSFDNAYKMRILSAYDACEDGKTRSAFLRQEGLYYSRIIAWREELASGKLKKHKQKKNQPRVDHLTREVMQLRKKLAQAEAIIDLQKKVSELLGTHILPEDVSEMN